MLSTVTVTALAHTSEWYSDHIDEATKTQQSCLKRLKADKQLGNEEMADCQRAGNAIVRDHKFTPSPPKSW
jgi:hypothetical protein